MEVGVSKADGLGGTALDLKARVRSLGRMAAPGAGEIGHESIVIKRVCHDRTRGGAPVFKSCGPSIGHGVGNERMTGCFPTRQPLRSGSSSRDHSLTLNRRLDRGKPTLDCSCTQSGALIARDPSLVPDDLPDTSIHISCWSLSRAGNEWNPYDAGDPSDAGISNQHAVGSSPPMPSAMFILWVRRAKDNLRFRVTEKLQTCPRFFRNPRHARLRYYSPTGKAAAPDYGRPKVPSSGHSNLQPSVRGP